MAPSRRVFRAPVLWRAMASFILVWALAVGTAEASVGVSFGEFEVEVATRVIDGAIYVPLEQFELLGGASWEVAEGRFRMQIADRMAHVAFGDDIAEIDGERLRFHEPIRRADERNWISLLFLADLVQASISLEPDPHTRTLTMRLTPWYSLTGRTPTLAEALQHVQAAPRQASQGESGWSAERIFHIGGPDEVEVAWNEADGRRRLLVSAARPFEVESMSLESPHRLVLDLLGIQMGEGQPVFNVDDQLIRRVRAAQHPDRTRIVVELTEGVGHERFVESGGRWLDIHFHRILREIVFLPSEEGGELRLGLPAQAEAQLLTLRSPERLVVDLPGVTLPQPMEASYDIGPVRSMRASQFSPAAARVVLELEHPLAASRLSRDGSIAFRLGEPSAHAGASPRVGYAAHEAGAVIIVEGRNLGRPVLASTELPYQVVMELEGVDWHGAMHELLVPGSPARSVRAERTGSGPFRTIVELDGPADVHVHQDPGGEWTALVIEKPNLAGARIGVDAGHGGYDVGAVGANLGILEKDVNLDIALRLGELLSGASAQVEQLREDDRSIFLPTRAATVMQLPVDYFVSIHANAAPEGSRAARGTEVFHQRENEISRRFALHVQEDLVSALGLPDRGVRSANFVVLSTEKPSILVEVAFLSHPEEERLLSEAWFRQMAAQAVFNGIVRFLRQEGVAAEAEADPQRLHQDVLRALQRGVTYLVPQQP